MFPVLSDLAKHEVMAAIIRPAVTEVRFAATLLPCAKLLAIFAVWRDIDFVAALALTGRGGWQRFMLVVRGIAPGPGRWRALKWRGIFSPAGLP